MIEETPLLKAPKMIITRRFPLDDAVVEEGLVAAEAHVGGDAI